MKGELVSFTIDDPAGLWRKGDAALDLGWESWDRQRQEPTTDVRLLRLLASGEVLSLSDPYGRGLVAVAGKPQEAAKHRSRPRGAVASPDAKEGTDGA